MISFTGYGLLLTIAMYGIGIFGGNYIARAMEMPHRVQVIFLLILHLALVAVNYTVAKALNGKGKEPQHTVMGIRLEKFGLVIGGILTLMVLMMVWGEFREVTYD
ncbi:MAG: hypothetical protein CSA07_01460 [Bacteroidia bacterium]|nr:MAG: hypothetical protein CSA07_01460 [Bacteroidia bacterium]